MAASTITRILADLRGDFVSRSLHVDDARALVEHIERLEREADEARIERNVYRAVAHSLRSRLDAAGVV